MKLRSLRNLMLGVMMAGTLAACGDSREGGADEQPVAVDGVNEPVPTPVDALDESLGLEQSAVVQQYMAVKDALFKDNVEGAKQAAATLQSSIEGPESAKLSDARKAILNESATKIANAQSIDEQRNAFAILSSTLYEVVKNKELTNKTLYWQHCPMAMNNKGANWLSMQEEIENPYMGQKMPKCGSVQETVN